MIRVVGSGVVFRSPGSHNQGWVRNYTRVIMPGCFSDEVCGMYLLFVFSFFLYRLSGDGDELW